VLNVPLIAKLAVLETFAFLAGPSEHAGALLCRLNGNPVTRLIHGADLTRLGIAIGNENVIASLTHQAAGCADEEGCAMRMRPPDARPTTKGLDHVGIFRAAN